MRSRGATTRLNRLNAPRCAGGVGVVILLVGTAMACKSAPQAVPEEDLSTVETGAGAATPDIPEPTRQPLPASNSADTEGKANAPEVARPPQAAPPPKKKRHSSGKNEFEQGVRADARGDLKAAELHFLASVEKDEDLEWGWYNLGLTREHRGDLGGARSAYQQALTVKPDFEEAGSNMTALLISQNKLDQAEREIRSRISKHPEALGFRNDLAHVLIIRGGRSNLDAAFSEARKVLKAEERNVGAMIVLGQVFFAQRKLELAGDVLDNAGKIDPSNAEAFNLRGFVFLAQKDREKAALAFKRAASLRPDFAEAHVNYGAFLNQSQSFADAITELELAVRYAPKMPEAHLNLGNAYRGAGHHKQAISEYRTVQRLDSSNRDVLFNMGLLYLDAPLEGVQVLDRLKKAKDYFERYKSKGGEDERLTQVLGDAAKAIKKEERKLDRDRKNALRKAKEEKEQAASAAERAASSRLGDDEEEEPPASAPGSSLRGGEK